VPTPQLQVPGVAAWAPSFPWSPEALSQLLALCEPAPVGLGEHTVVDAALRAGRGSHSSTSQFNLSRVCHKKTPYTP